jgi:hypothetical protein
LKLTQPVAKVHAFDVHFAELLPRPRTDGQCEKDIFNVSVAPIVALNLTERSNVASAERSGGTRPQNEQEEAW